MKALGYSKKKGLKKKTSFFVPKCGKRSTLVCLFSQGGGRLT